MNISLALMSTTHHQMKVYGMNFVLYEMFVFIRVSLNKFKIFIGKSISIGFSHVLYDCLCLGLFVFNRPWEIGLITGKFVNSYVFFLNKNNIYGYYYNFIQGDFMGMIEINQLTKDYGDHKGIFDLSISIHEGEVYGFLGPNGAGKSTTMRHVMGFSKPDSGNISVNNFDSWKEKEKIKENIGYLAGEIALPNDMTGLQYLKLISKMRKMKSFDYADELLKYFKIDPDVKIKSMSKGMKQKIAIVATFMHNPEIILLDEPTSGLDPLMQERFIELVVKEKDKGKTIFMSSHIFDEVSKVCDRVGIVKEGHLIKEVDMDSLRNNEEKTYIVKFKNNVGADKIMNTYPNSTVNDKQEISITIDDNEINRLINDLSTCDLVFLKEREQSLEEYFMKFYAGDIDD